MTGIRVLVVDDHPVFRDGLRQLLTGCEDIVSVAEAADGLEALAYVEHHRVDVVLMDLQMPTLAGVPAIRRLRALPDPPNVLVLSTYDSEEDVVAAVGAGAVGFLLKDAARTDILDGVRSAARGGTTLSPAVAGRLVGRVRGPEPDGLRPRDVDLLRLVASGATNREAAAELFVSEATVKAYLLRIYAALGARDRASAVAEAYRRGILP
jgi:DNA-binding NarL/FixJ family response regulator